MIINEYEQAFPFDREYTDWINCMEYDYAETPKLAVTDKVSFKYNTEEYSPYSTINS